LKERVHENDSFKSMNQESIIKPSDENLSKYMPNADVDFAEEKTTKKRKRHKSKSNSVKDVKCKSRDDVSELIFTVDGEEDAKPNKKRHKKRNQTDARLTLYG